VTGLPVTAQQARLPVDLVPRGNASLVARLRGAAAERPRALVTRSPGAAATPPPRAAPPRSPAPAAVGAVSPDASAVITSPHASKGAATSTYLARLNRADVRLGELSQKVEEVADRVQATEGMAQQVGATVNGHTQRLKAAGASLEDLRAKVMDSPLNQGLSFATGVPGSAVHGWQPSPK
jgi:hypothetical protein